MTIFEFIEVIILIAGSTSLTLCTSTRACRGMTVVSCILCGLVAFVRIWAGPDNLLDQIRDEGVAPVRAYLSLLPFVSSLLAIVVSGLSALTEMQKRSYLTLIALLGTTVLFPFVFSSFELVAMLWTLQSFLIWNELRLQKDGNGTARVFLIYQLLGAAALSVGLLLYDSERNVGISLIIVALVIRQAIFPLQSWMLPVFEKLPAALGIFYFLAQPGMVVFCALVIGKNASRDLTLCIAALFAFSAFYTAMLCHAQTSARNALATLFMSQSSIIFLGFLSRSPGGLAGTFITWFAVTLSLALFGMCIESLEARKGTLTLYEPAGNFAETPRIAISCLLSGLMSIGIPGSLVFFSEELLLLGVAEEYPIGVVLLVLTMTLNALSVMKFYFYFFTGSKKHEGILDFELREYSIVTFLLLILSFCSFYPGALFL